MCKFLYNICTTCYILEYDRDQRHSVASARSHKHEPHITKRTCKAARGKSIDDHEIYAQRHLPLYRYVRQHLPHTGRIFGRYSRVEVIHGTNTKRSSKKSRPAFEGRLFVALFSVYIGKTASYLITSCSYRGYFLQS